MRKITKIVFIFILLLNLVGCIEGNYLRDTSKGSIVEIKLDNAITIAEKEESIILFTQSTCKDCINLKKILITYLENHKVSINEVVLDNEGTSKEEIQNNRKKINKVFPEFDSTPSMYYVKNGKIIDEIFEVKSEEELDQWVIKNKLDAK
ncbi:thioredoxin family protein [Clostridium perfringens]|uniref:thioredoxin family protein n=1 Tax=Clostridium perfringens TaxID=1502 RepID=UPI001A301AAF|nr:thioredoxin family protein [Clostridium perfringens]MCX0413502.1 thioredoxin family protein [Clostridium perfringens]WFE18890.1 thioredoxin family protein [Clostridium perfringens]HAT4220493.1 thioredoxin family protein [Clostridium perfringens]HAT4355226.1 thioredoxin family protein [Clostridium perfringens]